VKFQLIEDLLGILKEDAPVKDMRIGAFWTAVWSENCGLASTIAGHDHEGRPPVAEPRALAGKSAMALAGLARS